jgi:GrpB-like predicted nucleotidyltransferase (UPF0157 family)
VDPRAERDAHLESVLIGGREPAAIVIRDYDRGWPARFSALRTRIQDALGTRALGIEHIGSTSVPGLAAKPIVDVLVTVTDVEDESAYAPALLAAAFPQRVREPGHRMFRTPERDAHVHVYQSGVPAVTDYLDLRDWLRESAQDRAQYASTKRALATRQWADMNDYADAKSDVIMAILTRARAWRSAIDR